MIKQYRKNPLIVEAVKWDGTNADEIINWAGEECIFKKGPKNVIFLTFITLEGTMDAQIGDFIIKGINGEFYPCKPDIFYKTYEEVTQ